jgi:hypothetical protein
VVADAGVDVAVASRNGDEPLRSRASQAIKYDCPSQGCQIVLDTMYQSCEKCTKFSQNYQSIQNGRKMFPTTIDYDNIFHSKTLQNLPRFGFLVWKYAIWQPCMSDQKKSSPFFPN